MAEFPNPGDLLASFRTGDETAYTVIFEKFYPKLVVFSYQITNNEAQSQDIASESLAKLFKRSHIYETTEHYENFLYVAARNASINYLRYLKTFTENYNEYVSRNADDIDFLNHELDAALLGKLFQSVERLPERSRQVINYLYIQKMSYQKAAELMETTVKNVENLRAYALKKLKDDLTQTSSPAVLLAFISFLISN
jgi:RNA polymerase sigma factor (sigma-70 family)